MTTHPATSDSAVAPISADLRGPSIVRSVWQEWVHLSGRMRRIAGERLLRG